LRLVQPADLSGSDIDAGLASGWIPAEDISRFAGERLGKQGISVCHVPQLWLWTVHGGYGVRSSVATTERGTDHCSVLELLEDADGI
jgi:N12 class adenine-specific DNA methylase